VPTASATNRGALSAADWTTFNSKGSGTVTSVAATVPAFLSVTGSPITSSGTLAISYSGTALPLANGGTGKTTAPAAQANLLGYTTTASTGLTTTGASGSAGTATITFAVQASAPYAVGSYISVQGVTPTGYNGMYQVTACTTTTVSYANATTAAQTVAGNISQITALTNTSSFYQSGTGTVQNSYSLPDTATLQLGWSFRINTQQLTQVYSSTGVLLTSQNNNSAYYYTCIDITVNTTAAWRVGVTEIGATTGSGNMVLSVGPTITGTLQFSGSNTSASNFHTTQSTGIMSMGGTAATGQINIGRSTAAQTIQIGNGITATATTKAIDIGINGASGSTTNITLGSATSGATGTTLFNNNVTYKGLIATTAAAPTIASAATIAPTTPILFVSGTTNVVTITAPSPISLGGGQITIIPTGLFVTTAAGNIALASVAVVNKALIMTYDVTTAKWYPSY
jgi:hypothetical protein